MTERRITYALVTLFLLFSLLDILSTLRGMQHWAFLASEANPLARWIYGIAGFGGVVAYKLAWVVAVLTLFRWQRIRSAFPYVLGALDGLLLITIIHNLSQ